MKIISRGPTHLLFEHEKTEQDDYSKCRLAAGREFYLSLNEEERERMCYQEFEQNPVTGNIQGQWRLYPERPDHPNEWNIGFKSIIARDQQLKQRAEEVIRETSRLERIESIPTMTNDELAAFLRESVSNPEATTKATVEALARILTKIDNG